MLASTVQFSRYGRVSGPTARGQVPGPVIRRIGAAVPSGLNSVPDDLGIDMSFHSGEPAVLNCRP